jgi:hypothetical protein
LSRIILTDTDGPLRTYTQILDAAVRPIEPAIRARRSILMVGASLSNKSYKFMAVALDRSYKGVTETQACIVATANLERRTW